MKDEEEDKKEEARREKMFWDLLGGRVALEGAAAGGDDAESEVAWISYRKLFEVKMREDWKPPFDPKEMRPVCSECSHPLKQGFFWLGERGLWKGRVYLFIFWVFFFLK